MTKGKVVYVGPYSFPNGGAAARRILGNCLSLRDAGYDVTVTSGQMQDDCDVSECEGFPVVSLNERCYEQYPALVKHFLYLGMGKKAVKWLDNIDKKPLAIILYSGYSPYLIQLSKWCRQNDVKLIFDAVEWYEPPSLIAKFISPYHLNIALAMNYLSPRTKNIIAISNYLENYYVSMGCHTINVPPTLDLQEITPRLNRSEKNTLKLVYTGVPGKKDLLGVVMQAVVQLNQEGILIELHLGGDCSALINQYSDFVALCIFNHGFLSHSEALDLVRNADFSVLFRPDQRSSHAGFSTKFVESLSLGTPVIGNITSDLEAHLIDGKTGVVCKSTEVDAVKEKIKLAAGFGKDVLEKMRACSREHAEKNFDYRVHTGKFSSFIQNLMG